MAIHFQGKREQSVPCYRNLNLLAHAQLEEIPTGSRCGGHGVCGGDRVFIPLNEQGPLSPPTEIERTHLSPEDIQKGIRLACQVYPAEDDLNLTVRVL